MDGGGTREAPKGASVLNGVCELLHPHSPTTVIKTAGSHFIGRFLSATGTLEESAQQALDETTANPTATLPTAETASKISSTKNLSPGVTEACQLALAARGSRRGFRPLSWQPSQLDGFAHKKRMFDLPIAIAMDMGVYIVPDAARSNA